MLPCNKYFKIKINVLQVSDKAVYQDEIVHFLKGNIIHILCECEHRWEAFIQEWPGFFPHKKW